MGYTKADQKIGWKYNCYTGHHKRCKNKDGTCKCPCHGPKVVSLMEERVKDMKCGCGAEYRVYEHKTGYFIRCVNYRQHEVENNGL